MAWVRIQKGVKPYGGRLVKLVEDRGGDTVMVDVGPYSRSQLVRVWTCGLAGTPLGGVCPRLTYFRDQLIAAPLTLEFAAARA